MLAPSGWAVKTDISFNLRALTIKGSLAVLISLQHQITPPVVTNLVAENRGACELDARQTF
jgi:hypothetical protein